VSVVASIAASGLESRRIARALARRERYRYVHPEVIAEGGGWKVVSPCCSRRVDPDGGVIDIAWIEPSDIGWRLHRHDHSADAWQPVLESRRFQDLMDRLSSDPLHEFWV